MYKVADIVFDARDCGSTFAARAEKYRVSEGLPEFTLTLTEEELEAAREVSRLSEDGIRYMMSGSKFYFELINRKGFMLHSSAVVKDGRAYLFSGPSGMGKSTHTGFWLELFPDAYILNDDKPAVRSTDNGFYAYGTPWSGKHDISRNTGVPIGGIAFIERSDVNFIEPMPVKNAVFGMIAQTVRHIRRERMEELLDTVEMLISSAPVYRLGCTKDISAAELAYEVMSHGAASKNEITER